MKRGYHAGRGNCPVEKSVEICGGKIYDKWERLRIERILRMHRIEQNPAVDLFFEITTAARLLSFSEISGQSEESVAVPNS